jgi:hypothetical protein
MPKTQAELDAEAAAPHRAARVLELPLEAELNASGNPSVPKRSPAKSASER